LNNLIWVGKQAGKECKGGISSLKTVKLKNILNFKIKEKISGKCRNYVVIFD